MIVKKSFIILLISCVSLVVYSQELRCNISVNASKLPSANKNVFQSMRTDLSDFMNNKAWTKHVYTNDERIECSFNIQITQQVSSNEYKAILTVQSKRPVFNSSYKTTLLNIQDENFTFEYQEYQAIEFNETSNKDNLTSVLAYYAYVILGYDYDTFSLNGGTKYFEKAREIVSGMQSVSELGWKSHESDYNRYWLVDNILNKSYAAFRAGMYKYHRTGLDVMSEQSESGRAEVLQSLRSFQRVFRAKSKLYILQAFYDAKSAEIISIFSEGNQDEKERMVKIMNEIDPTNSSRYETVLKTE